MLCEARPRCSRAYLSLPVLKERNESHHLHFHSNAHTAPSFLQLHQTKTALPPSSPPHTAPTNKEASGSNQRRHRASGGNQNCSRGAGKRVFENGTRGGNGRAGADLSCSQQTDCHWRLGRKGEREARWQGVQMVRRGRQQLGISDERVRPELYGVVGGVVVKEKGEQGVDNAE